MCSGAHPTGCGMPSWVGGAFRFQRVEAFGERPSICTVWEPLGIPDLCPSRPPQAQLRPLGLLPPGPGPGLPHCLPLASLEPVLSVPRPSVFHALHAIGNTFSNRQAPSWATASARVGED